jgi:hypothetical protein
MPLAKSMPPPDADVLRRRDVHDTLGRSLAESFRKGIRAATWDGVAVARGEGFRLEQIRTEGPDLAGRTRPQRRRRDGSSTCFETWGGGIWAPHG